jgi:hypothetical protein
LESSYTAAEGEVRLVRIARLVLLGLLLAASVSAVAMAVDKQDGAKQTKEDAPEATVTVTGVLHTTADGYAVGSRSVSLGPPWYAASSALIKDRLGKSVTVTGSADDNDGELSVRTIDGVAYRAKGRPPWAGGPKHHGTSASACKAKAKAKAKAAKAKGEDKSQKARDGKGGPPPWAKAYGRRCTP